MSAAGIRAGRAFVEIGTDQTLFDRGIKAVRASMQRLSASAATIGRTLSSGFGAANGALKTMAGGLLNTRTLLAGALGGAGLTMLAKNFADAGSALADMSARTGASAEELSALGYAAKMTGSDMGAVEKALRKLQQSGKVLSGMTATQSLIAYADQIAAIQDPAKRAETAIKLFGRSGVMLLPMLANGSQGLQDMADQAADLGLIMSSDDAAAADTFGDAIDNLMLSIGGITNRIGATLAPTLTDLVNRITDVVITVSDFINENRELVVTLAQWGAVGAGVLAGVAALGGAGLILSGIFTGLATVGGAVATVLTGLGGVLAFLISPLGMLSVAILGATGAMVYFSGVGTSLLTYLGDQWTALLDWILPVIDSIKLALLSGQWAAAGQIAMLALEMAVRTGVQPLYNIWTDLYSFIATGAINAMVTVANVFAGIPTAIMSGFGTAITWLTGTWDQTVNYIAKKLLYLYSLFDKSIDYEAAAKQMDTEANQRANERQRSLDEANAKRDQDLQEANAGRLQFADQLNQGIRDQANERKNAFDDRVKEINAEINLLMGQVGEEAAKQPKRSKPERPLVPDYAPQMQMSMGDAQKAVGTFSGFGAGLASGGGVNNSLRSMVKLQTQANNKLDQIAENTEDAGDGIEYGD